MKKRVASILLALLTVCEMLSGTAFFAAAEEVAPITDTGTDGSGTATEEIEEIKEEEIPTAEGEPEGGKEEEIPTTEGEPEGGKEEEIPTAEGEPEGGKEEEIPTTEGETEGGKEEEIPTTEGEPEGGKEEVAPVKYLDTDKTGTVTEKSRDDVIRITGEETVFGAENTETWYYSSGDITFEGRMTFTGDVKLILADNSTLTFANGIWVANGQSFTVYAQSQNRNTAGSLIADGYNGNAAIGGNRGPRPGWLNNGNPGGNAGKITIHGGNIIAAGHDETVGIGGGRGTEGDGGYQQAGGGGYLEGIYVYSGYVKVTSENYNAIGGGRGGNSSIYGKAGNGAVRESFISDSLKKYSMNSNSELVEDTSSNLTISKTNFFVLPDDLFTVTYYYNYFTVPYTKVDVKYPVGTFGNLPDIMKHEERDGVGYTLIDWCTDEECLNSFEWKDECAGTTVELYAKWIRDSIVTFDYRGYGPQNINPAVKYLDTVAAPEYVTETYEVGGVKYNFDKWCADEECTVDFDFSTKITEDTVVYAKWRKSPVYTFVFPDQTTVERQEGMHIPADLRFAEQDGKLPIWYTDAECTELYDVKTVVSGEDVTLYGKLFDVSYYEYDENGVGTKKIVSDKNITLLTSELDNAKEQTIGAKDTELWVLLAGDVTLTKRVTILGDVHFILANKAHYTFENGIWVANGQSFTVYAQSQNRNTAGSLIAEGYNGNAAIGGNRGPRPGWLDNGNPGGNAGKITIHGGNIIVTGHDETVGIGGGRGTEGDGGYQRAGGGGYLEGIYVYSGYVKVTSENYNAIGGGRGGNSSIYGKAGNGAVRESFISASLKKFSMNSNSELVEDTSSNLTISNVNFFVSPDDLFTVTYYYNYFTIPYTKVDVKYPVGAFGNLLDIMKHDTIGLEGYTLTGWYTNSICTIPFDLTTVQPGKKVTVYAGWEIDKIVTFDYRGYGPQDIETVVWYQKPVSEPEFVTESFEIDGVIYNFEKWCADEECTVDFDFSTKITEDTVVYAKWRKSPVYTFVFPNDMTEKRQEAMFVPANLRFAAINGMMPVWYTDADCTELYDIKTVVSGEDVTLYAKLFDATFYEYDENGVATKKIVSDKNVTLLTSELDNAKEQIIGADNTELWVLLSGDITLTKRVTVLGDVHFILANGANAVFENGICVGIGHVLTVYAQSQDINAVGSITARGNSGSAAIGGNFGYGASNWSNGNSGGGAGKFIVHGGRIYATGSGDSVGIGGGRGGDGITAGRGGLFEGIFVYHGFVSATSEKIRAIGGGKGGNNNGAVGNFAEKYIAPDMLVFGGSDSESVDSLVLDNKKYVLITSRDFVEFVPVKSQNCTETGLNSYYKVENISFLFGEGGAISLITDFEAWKNDINGGLILANGHHWKSDNIRDGADYYSCRDCTAENEERKTEATTKIKHDGTDATCADLGTKDYYYLGGYYFEDEGCTVMIDDLDAWLWDLDGGLIDVLPHTYASNNATSGETFYTCKNCGYVDAARQKTAARASASGFTLSGGSLWIIIIGAVVILGVIAAIVVITKKKKKTAHSGNTEE